MMITLAMTSLERVSVWQWAVPLAILLVVLNGITLAALYYIFGKRRQREERAAASKASKIFSISEQALGYIQEGMNSKNAKDLAELLAKELHAAAVTIIGPGKVLAHVNVTDHDWHPEELLQNSCITEMMKSASVEMIHCQLAAPAILIPFKWSEQSAGMIVVYFEREEQIGQWEIAFAEGLGKLISYQLSIIETERLRLLLKDTEMRALQAQINPHFLFNTLNIIVSLIRTNPDQAREVMMHLSNFMRMNLRLTSSALVSLEQELCLLESFMQIIQIRFADQLRIELVMDEDLQYFKIPPVTIQPLVENCIQHGLRKKSGVGEITVKIVKADVGAQVIVEDNGNGISEERLSLLKKQHIYSRKGNGIGFFNVNQRLTSLLGERSHLHIENRQSGGCRVSFFLPNMYSDWGNNR